MKQTLRLTREAKLKLMFRNCNDKEERMLGIIE